MKYALQSLICSCVFSLMGVVHAEPILVQKHTSAVPNECKPYSRHYCKHDSGDCSYVYVSQVNTEMCQSVSKQNIQTICNTSQPKFYQSQQECLDLPTSNLCPQKLDQISQEHVALLPTCKNLHTDFCHELCGAEFNKTDVRPIAQDPQQRLGLLCFNDELSKKPTTACTEVHGGATGAAWCVQYQLAFRKIELGSLVQCVQKISQSDQERIQKLK